MKSRKKNLANQRESVKMVLMPSEQELSLFDGRQCELCR